MSKGDKAETNNSKKYKCQWEGCKKEHYEKIEYDQKNIGCTERGDYSGPWFEPFNIVDLDSYTQHGIKEGRFTRLKSTRVYYLEIHKSSALHYSTQNHHIIPVDVMAGSQFKALRINLELVGWDINNGMLNGICLPYFKEDYIWHNLQPHRGFHPAMYTDEVEMFLEPLEEICKTFCTKGEDELSEEDTYTLLEEIYDAVTEIRNDVLNWEIFIHRDDTLTKWVKQVKTGTTTGQYVVNGKPSEIPALSKPSGREYYEIAYE